MKSQLSRSLLTAGFIGLAAFPLQARAQSSCENLFSDATTSPSFKIDPRYADSMAQWSAAWRDNALTRLRGIREPLVPTDSNFSIRDFHESREFYTWFQDASRMALDGKNKAEASKAQVRLLDSGPNALASKIVAIRQAKHTIDMAYYIIRPDESTYAVLGELKEAVRRGVSVRIMFDGLGAMNLTFNNPLRALLQFAKTDAGFMTELDGSTSKYRATVEVVEFNPPSSLFTNTVRSFIRSARNFVARNVGATGVAPIVYSLNRRSHDKILLIDGAFQENSIAFIGGRNLADDYYGDEKTNNDTFSDTEFVIKGVSTSSADTSTSPGTPTSPGTQMQEYFDRLYFHLGNRILSRTLLGMVTGYKGTLNKIGAVR